MAELTYCSIAGGETVATFLAATTYYVLRAEGQGVYTALCDKIRRRYDSYQEIDSVSAQHLPYLQAVINEGLETFPPGSQGFPRLSPGRYVDGYWVPPGVSLYRAAQHISQVTSCRLMVTDRDVHKCMDNHA